MSESGESLADEGDYMLPPESMHPAIIAEDLLKLPEFEDILVGEAKIDWLLKRDEKVRNCRQVLGTVHMPKVPGDLNPCFKWMLTRLFGRESDFLIVLDKRYWYQAPPRRREILVYHELSHCIHKRDGNDEKRYDFDERPIWGLRGHDVEEFTAVVRRYGAWTEELESFCAAVAAYTEQERLAGGAPHGH